MRLRKPYSIPTGREFRIDNFSLGMRRDGATTENRMYALRTIKNYYIDYTEGKLVIRPGYSRYNSTALPNPADQLYWFGDMDGNQHLLGKIGGTTDMWYKIAESGAHTNICAHACTSRRPAFGFGNRVFFGTDKDITEVSAGGNGLQWADNTSIGTGDSYRVGIKPPSQGPTISTTDAEGRTETDDTEWFINNTDQYKIGIPYTPTVNIIVGGIRINLERSSAKNIEGNIRISIYEAGDDGYASSTLADDNAQSNWVSVTQVGVTVAHDYVLFTFPKLFQLDASTDYIIVIEGDDLYHDQYTIVSPT